MLVAVVYAIWNIYFLYSSIFFFLLLRLTNIYVCIYIYNLLLLLADITNTNTHKMLNFPWFHLRFVFIIFFFKFCYIFYYFLHFTESAKFFPYNNCLFGCGLCCWCIVPIIVVEWICCCGWWCCCFCQVRESLNFCSVKFCSRSLVSGACGNGRSECMNGIRTIQKYSKYAG